MEKLNSKDQDSLLNFHSMISKFKLHITFKVGNTTFKN